MLRTNGSGYPNQVQSDGRLICNVRDPPGQRSVYIPPGDPKREVYRLSTFREFPRESPIHPCDCAFNGFYYTGYRDRIKCFSCGQAVDQWFPNDDVASSMFHSQECDFINGRESGNIPIPRPGSRASRYAAPARSQERSHESVALVHPPRRLVESSPQQLSAGQVLMQRSSTNISGSAQHRPTRSTTPSSVRATLLTSESRNQHQPRQLSSIVTAPSFSRNRNSNPTSSSERRNAAFFRSDLLALFPCSHPVTPEMRSYDARLQTFLRNLGVWPQHRIRATPQDIAAAGMYFLGERDRTQCWYCHGGLQNWDRDDDPWEEHAKWFPMCEFILQQRGPDFVHEILVRFPNLRRSVVQAPPVTSSSLPSQHHTRSGFQSPAIAATPGSSRVREIVSPREESRIRNQKIEEEITSSAIVFGARQMGFAEKEIKAALKRQYELNNEGFGNLEAMVDTILSLPEDAQEEEHTPLPPVHSSPSTSSSSATSSIQEMQRLEENRRCRVCGNGLAQVVFLPCGHLVCCEECGGVVNSCPVCATSIRERICSYLS